MSSRTIGLVLAAALCASTGSCASPAATPESSGGVCVAQLRMVQGGQLPAMQLTADGHPIANPAAPFKLSPGVHKLKFMIDGKRHLLYGNFSPPGRFIIEIHGEPGDRLTMELRPI